MSTFREGLGEEDTDGRWHRPKSWKPTLDKPYPPVRCESENGRGMQCANSAVNGGKYCPAHSTKEDRKQAQEMIQMARLRMVDLADQAIDTIKELMEPGTADAVRLKAATEVLDRSGVVKGETISIQLEQSNRGADIVAEKIAAIRDRKKADEEIISVEEVTEDDDS